MASAHTLPLALDRCLRGGFFDVSDPGASGTFSLINKGHGIARVVTAGAETRTLPTASGHAVGTRLAVVFKTDGGDLTISGSDQTVVLTNAGEVVEFVVSDNNGTNAWRVASDSRVQYTDTMSGERTESIPIPAFRIWDSLDAQLGATPASADDAAHVIGTFLTDAGYITTTSQTPGDANPVVSRCRVIRPVPQNYQAGSALTLRIVWARADAAATSLTVDAEVVRVAAPSVDVCATTAASINAAASGTTDFTLTPTNLVPGELLNIRLTLTAVSNGASYEGRISSVSLVYTV